MGERSRLIGARLPSEMTLRVGWHCRVRWRAAADAAKQGGIAERDSVVEWARIATVDTAEQNEIAE